MKKFILSGLVILLFFINQILGQTFQKGDFVGNITIGFGSSMYLGYGYGSPTYSIPAISLSGDYGLLDNLTKTGIFSIGAVAGYKSESWSYYGYTAKASDILIGPRSTFHYQFIEKLDTYIGLELILDLRSWSNSSSISYYNYIPSSLTSKTYVRIPGFIGARYYFTDKIGALAEFGWGIAYFNIGLSLKLQ